jgi:predicted esterase YcpF (UPF0227 family)
MSKINEKKYCSKTLFLHGLESLLSDNKRETLLKFSEDVISPTLDYKNNPNIFQFLVEKYQYENIDVIIGSSMGGLMGYYLSRKINVPCLLFNPALPYRGVPQNIEKNIGSNSLTYIVLGKKDNIINFKENFEFIMNDIKDNDDIQIKIINKLVHRIPFEIFSQEVFNFFEQYINFRGAK